MARKKYDDDDGHSIADMSMFSSPEARSPETGRRKIFPGRSEDRKGFEISPEGQRGAMLGAMAAAMLIGLVFIVGIGLVIAAICLLT